MDPWKMFCELCKRVAEEQNVYLDVIITEGLTEMMLMPYDEDWEEEDDTDDYQ